MNFFKTLKDCLALTFLLADSFQERKFSFGKPEEETLSKAK